MWKTWLRDREKKIEMTMERETKQVALVTGASKGLGKALSRELVERGWTVVGVARSKRALDDLQLEIGSDAFIPRVCDVSSVAEVKAVSEGLRTEGLMPSLFFLNAGIAGEAACESPSDFVLAKHEQIFATNYFGVLTWVEEWLPFSSVHRSTTFVATGSINAIFAPPTGSAYAASKAAIAKAFEGLSMTYPSSRALFSVVYAGPIATEGLKGNLPFTWEADRMAKYMVCKALKGKTHIENSTFYSVFARLLRILPKALVMRIIGQNKQESA